MHILAIHGVGRHPERKIEKEVAENFSSVLGEGIKVQEFNWDSFTRHFTNHDLLPSLRQASRDTIHAGDLGFTNSSQRYNLHPLVRGIDRLCHPVARWTTAILGAGLYLILMLIVLAAISLVFYSDLGWLDFTDQGATLAWIALSLLAVSVITSLIPLLVAGSMAIVSKRAQFRILLRRYLLLWISRVILVITLPLQIPRSEILANVYKLLLFFVGIYLVLSIFPFSYGIFLSEKLRGTGLPLHLILGIIASWLTIVFLAWFLTWWEEGPLDVLLDIFRYLADPKCRAEIQNRLDKRLIEIPVGARRVLLAHSLGSVIALDSLLNSERWSEADDVLLITMGSPIRRSFLQFFPRFLFPESIEKCTRRVEWRVGRFRWLNVHRPLDYVGTRLGVPARVGGDISTGQWKKIISSHSHYWSDPVLPELVGKALPRLEKLTAPPRSAATERGWIPVPAPAAPEGSLFLAIGTAIFALVLWGFFATTLNARDHRNARIEERVAVVRLHTEPRPAAVTHVEVPEVGGDELEHYYYNRFMFELLDTDDLPSLTGIDNITTIDIPSWIAYPEERRWFDDKALREHVREVGTLLEEPRLLKRGAMLRRRVEGIDIRIWGGDPKIVLVEDYPPVIADWSAHFGFGMRFITTALLMAGVGAWFGVGVLRVFLGLDAED